MADHTTGLIRRRQRQHRHRHRPRVFHPANDVRAPSALLAGLPITTTPTTLDEAEISPRL